MKKDLAESRIYYILLVLASMNFRAQGSMLFILLALFVIIRFRFCLTLDWCSGVAFVLMLSIFIASLVYYDISDCIKSANYLFAYVIGFDGYRQATDKWRFVKRSIFSVFLGASMFLGLELCYNAGKVFITNRLLLNIWTGDYISVTLVGLVSSITIGYACYGIFFSKNRKLAVFSGSMLFVAIVLNFRTATRTPFAIIIILLVLIAVIKWRGQGIREHLKMIMQLSAAFLVVVVFLRYNVTGIRTLIFDSNLYARLYGTDSISRVGIALNHFTYALEYPFGGDHIAQTVGISAHNILQEGYDKFGCVAALCELILTCSIGRNILKLAKKREKEKMDWLFLCMYIPMLMQSFLEPIHDGYPILFWNLLMIHGMSNGYLQKRKTPKLVE